MSEHKDDDRSLHIDKEKSAKHAPRTAPRRFHVAKRAYIVIGISLVLIAIVVATLLRVVPQAEKQDDTGNRPATVTADERTIDDIMNVSDAKTVVVTEEATTTGAQAPDGSLVYDFAPYQPEGVQFKTLPSTGKGVAFAMDRSGADAQLTKLSALLTSNGYAEKSTDVSDAGGLRAQRADDIVSYKVYTSDKAVCSLAHIDASKTATGQHVIGVGCASIPEYQKNAQATEPFYAARSDKNSRSAPEVFSLLKTEDGEDGYKRAAVYQNKSSSSAEMVIALYYSNEKGDNWTYLTAIDRDGTTPCSLYAPESIKKAFKGTACMDHASKTLTTI